MYIQKQPLLLLISRKIMIEDTMKNSKTTFVTVNLEFLEENNKFIA